MPGTGLYATKAAPTILNDTIDGAPVGQVVKLATGGLGTADAFKGGYIKSGVTAPSDYQPTATAPNTGGHVWDASTEHSAPFPAWKAADDNAATSWISNDIDPAVTPQWWRYTPPSTVRFGKCTLQECTARGPAEMVKDFLIQGWDGSWHTLLDVSGEVLWGDGEKRTFEFLDTAADYTQYRIYITDNNAGDRTAIGEVEWFESDEVVRSIVSHIDDEVTLEGDISGLGSGYPIAVYDAWSSIQSALDQLWTDQGSAAFTASQYIRIFAGSYDENVVPNAGLNPDEILGFLFIMEGDPTDSRDNIVLDASAGANTILVACDQMIVRHMTVTGTNISDDMIASVGGNSWFEVNDCVLDTDFTGARYAVKAQVSGTVKDCHITSACGGVFINQSGAVERCFIKTAATRACVQMYEGGLVYSCVLDGALYGFITANYGTTVVANCTFYNITYGVWDPDRVSNARLLLINNVFKDVTYPFAVAQTTNFWPEETATQFGRRLLLRNNCSHGYTAFAYRNHDAATKTYAEFAALNGVDASGDLDQVNPLLTDPGAGDFSLQDASPCINTGHGSGVTSGYLGTDFDPNHPDIGAWSSGAAAAHLTPVLDSWANVGDGETVTLTVSNVEGSRTVHAFYRLSGSMAAFTESPTTRTGPGDLNVGGLEEGSTYEGYVITSDGVSSDMPSLPSNLLTFTPSLVLAGDAIALEGQGLLDLQLNDNCDDLEVVNLDLAIVDGTVQIKQALCIALRLFMGEWFLDGNAGVPYYQNVLVKNPDLSGINSILKAEILKVANVNKILEFSSSQDSATRRLSVSFRVDTVFGPVTVEETL